MTNATTPPPQSNQVDEWREWLSGNGKVWKDLVRVLLNRDIWKETQSVLGANAESLPSSYFWQYLVETYVDSQVIAVRRLTDNTGKTKSLRRILEELKRRPQHIKLSDWVHLDGASRHHWVRSFGEPINGHLDPAYAGQLLRELRSASERVNLYANGYTAHASKTPKVTELRWDDLNAAIDGVWEVYLACDYLVCGSTMHYDSDALGLGWDAVFDIPWRRAPIPRAESSR